ncbi:MAG: AAA family ATPase [Archaeoglobaceae archaeon]|nr:AAA family ATPase [Archaeoglobaceae archaeon]MDW8014202.1 AAA family ATPase [Archaeoglobaceae archaeon]
MLDRIRTSFEKIAEGGNLKITISGLPGTGKTTVGKILAKKLNLKFISAGEIFRKFSEQRGLTLEEFSKFAEENPEIDNKIDQMQKELAEKEKDAIFEGRLSGWFIKDANLKIWLFANEEIRYERIAKREGKDISVVKSETKMREELEKTRYKKFYGIDLEDVSIYDLIINSGKFTAEEIAEIVIKALEFKVSDRKS